MNDILITKLEILPEVTDIGVEAMKKLPTYRRYRYTQKAIYTLADGRIYESLIRSKSRRGLVEEADSIGRNISRRAVKAIIDDGKFYGTSVSS